MSSENVELARRIAEAMTPGASGSSHASAAAPSDRAMKAAGLSE